MQRVVAGSLGGRHLLPLPRELEGVRPSSERVRAAIFDRLRDEIVDARVLDLCAGSGALSIEALSRGAQLAVLVERDKQVAAFLRRQLDKLGILTTGSRAQAHVVVADAESYLLARGRFQRGDTSRASGRRREESVSDPGGRFDLIVLDPPWADLNLTHALLQAIVSGRWLSEGGCVVVSQAARSAVVVPHADYVEERELRHGDAALRFLRRRDPQGTPAP